MRPSRGDVLRPVARINLANGRNETFYDRREVTFCDRSLGDVSRPVARRIFPTGRKETFYDRSQCVFFQLVEYNVRIVYCVRKGDKRFISSY